MYDMYFAIVMGAVALVMLAWGVGCALSEVKDRD